MAGRRDIHIAKSSGMLDDPLTKQGMQSHNPIVLPKETAWRSSRKGQGLRMVVSPKLKDEGVGALETQEEN